MAATGTSGLREIAPYVKDAETRELVQIVLGAENVAEADLALVALDGRVPDRARIAAANLREVLRSIPATPCGMAVDDALLERTAMMKRVKGELVRKADRDHAVIVRAEGNRCIDLVLRVGRERTYWSTRPGAASFAEPEAIDAIMDSPELLAALLDVTIAMGLEFDPKIYLSLEDWHLEHAAETLEQLAALFRM